MLKVTDSFNHVERPYNGEPILKEVSSEGSYIKLDNGVTLEMVSEGRLFDKDSPDKYAAVFEAEDENSIGSLVGYIKLD